MILAASLFKKPFDLPTIDAAYRDDNFIMLAFILAGFEENWRIYLEQTAEILELYESDGRDAAPVYRFVAMLVDRAETFQDTGQYLDEMVSALGVLPGTGFIDEIKMAHLHKIDPQAWQREKNRRWVENYKAQMGALGRKFPEIKRERITSILPAVEPPR